MRMRNYSPTCAEMLTFEPNDVIEIYEISVIKEAKIEDEIIIRSKVKNLVCLLYTSDAADE